MEACSAEEQTQARPGAGGVGLREGPQASPRPTASPPALRSGSCATGRQKPRIWPARLFVLGVPVPVGIGVRCAPPESEETSDYCVWKSGPWAALSAPRTGLTEPRHPRQLGLSSDAPPWPGSSPGLILEAAMQAFHLQLLLVNSSARVALGGWAVCVCGGTGTRGVSGLGN